METAHFGGILRVVLVTEQFSVKHLYTGHYQAINPYTTMVDKDMTFCTIFVNDSLRNAKIYPQSRPSMKNGRPSRRHLRKQNEMKLRDLWEVWEVHQFRLSNMTTKIVFVPQLTYQTPKNLFDPTVKYCTIGPYLQSRCHQRRLLSLSRRGTQSQKRSVTQNCH